MTKKYIIGYWIAFTVLTAIFFMGITYSPTKEYIRIKRTDAEMLCSEIQMPNSHCKLLFELKKYNEL